MTTNVNNMASPGGGNNLGDPALGPHYARLVGFCFVGIHERQAYQGTPKDPCGKLLFTFELLDDFVEIDGVQRPRWVTKKENAFSTVNANAVKIYNKLDPTNAHGGNFDELAIANTPCMITIGPRKDSNNNPIDGTRIEDISPVAKAPDGSEYALAAAQNPTIVYDFDEPTAEAYALLKPWMQKEVKAAQNYAGSAAERVAQAHDALAGQAPAQQAAPQAAPTANQAPPLQQAAPNQAPPPLAGAPVAQQQAPAPAPAPVAQQQSPAAPPGFRYDAATNSFVADTAAQQAPPPGGPAY